MPRGSAVHSSLPRVFTSASRPSGLMLSDGHTTMVLRKVLTVDVPTSRPGRALLRAVVLGVVSTIVLILGLAAPATTKQKISEEGVCGPAPDAQSCTESEQEPA